MADEQELQAVIQGSGYFTNQLYNILSREDANVFFSPISVHAVLAMAYQGANGLTKDAFTTVLGVPDSNQAAKGYKDVISHLNNLPDVQLLMANKIYLMEGYSLKKTFKEVVEERFLSEVEAVNFADSQGSAAKINDWVASKTQNKIKQMFSPDNLDALTRLVLVNAIYFKGSWATPFNKLQTGTETFYLSDDDSIDVQMMNTSGIYFCKEDTNLDAKVLELPYANREISLVVVLPNERNGIGELERMLASIDLSEITEGMFKQKVLVKLPKFKIETTIKLEEPLKELGLGVIFRENADFSGMLEEEDSLYVSNVIQKAIIEVNEEGTEAAAATGAAMYLCSLLSPPSPPPVEFYVDHEFVFLLTYKKQFVLFSGRLTYPKY